jgi:general secretion pathway protein M
MSAQMASLQAARDELRTKWQALAPRERQLVTAMLSVLALVLIVMLGVRPALKTLKETPAQLKEVNATLDDMRRMADEVKIMRQIPPVPQAQAEAMLRSATERLGPTARMRTEGDRAIINMGGISGSKIAEWLTEVRSGARVKPIEGNFQQTEPGMYSGTITLVFAGGQPGGR